MIVVGGFSDIDVNWVSELEVVVFGIIIYGVINNGVIGIIYGVI